MSAVASACALFLGPRALRQTRPSTPPGCARFLEPTANQRQFPIAPCDLRTRPSLRAAALGRHPGASPSLSRTRRRPRSSRAPTHSSTKTKLLLLILNPSGPLALTAPLISHSPRRRSDAHVPPHLFVAPGAHVTPPLASPHPTVHTNSISPFRVIRAAAAQLPTRALPTCGKPRKGRLWRPAAGHAPRAYTPRTP